jgi:hypothetical protein
MLPDVVLLGIFDFYMDENHIEGWHTLVHVCREWRSIVFGSPRRLDLRLLCTASTSVGEMLGVWPPLPIVVRAKRGSVDNIISALVYNDRICQLQLSNIQTSEWEKLLAAMQRPFPGLTNLQLQYGDEAMVVDPDSFLGGSAPSLRTLILDSIPFPRLPKLLLSATQLVDLDLRRIPHSGYFSPGAILTALSTLTRLKKLNIGFESPSRPVRKSLLPPPLTRTLLPILTEFHFKGVDKYLEDLVARIDAPLLDCLHIIFFYQPTFDTPQLTQLINRTPKFKAQDRARVIFADWDVWVTLPRRFDGRLSLGVSGRQLDLQLSSLTQVCRSSFPQALILAVEHLYIPGGLMLRMLRQDTFERSQWLEFFHPFTAVKSLYISVEFTTCIAPVLQELVGERVFEVLPALETLFLEGTYPSGPVPDAIGQFVAARQLAGHPIAVFRWEGMKDVWEDELGI